MTIKLGVLISGSGTNLQAIIDAIAVGTLDASVELVISSKPDAFGLKRAEQAGIPTMALSREVYEDPIAADEIIAGELRRAGCDYVVMAGYMRMVHEPVLLAFEDRVVNIHPALLPSFKGAHGIADAFISPMATTIAVPSSRSVRSTSYPTTRWIRLRSASMKSSMSCTRRHFSCSQRAVYGLLSTNQDGKSPQSAHRS